LYVFNQGGDKKFYTGSADWMQRNFDYRVEVICPIYDENIKKELWELLEIQMKDNVKARWLDPDRLNEYRKNKDDEIHRAQFETYEYFKNKL